MLAFDTINTIFWRDPWAQVVGLIALVIGASAFIQKHDDTLRRNLTVYTLLMGLQFMMLGLWAGALMAWLGTIRTYASMHTKNIWIMSGFIAIALVVALPSVKQFIDVFPIIGTTLGTWAMFREKGLRMRLLMFIGTICWLSHNFVVGSIGGTIIEALFLLINARTMVKLLSDERKQVKA